MPEIKPPRLVKKRSDVECLTPEECGILYRNLMNTWLNREDNYLVAKDVVTRLYRRWMGMDIKK